MTGWRCSTNETHGHSGCEANAQSRHQLATKAGWDGFVNAAPRADLELLTRAELAALSAEDREDYDEARMVWNANLPTVKTQQLAAAFDVIDQVMASNRRDADRLRGSVVIDAAPGLGKTTIATRYARDFHRRAYRRLGPKTASGSQRLPVAFVPLSAGITLKGLNQKILAFYGHPAANRASSTRLGALAVDCVDECETQLIVIDDLHFIDFRHRNGQEVSNHLKGLANEMPVTFIYVGVRLREKRFFDEGILGSDAVYAQTSRRATRCEVAPFGIGTTAGMRAWTDAAGRDRGASEAGRRPTGHADRPRQGAAPTHPGPHRLPHQPDRPRLLPRHRHRGRDHHHRSARRRDRRQCRPDDLPRRLTPPGRRAAAAAVRSRAATTCDRCRSGCRPGRGSRSCRGCVGSRGATT